jgi:hypothetical protein
MSNRSDFPYSVKNPESDQAEPSTANRGAAAVQIRILIELQVISMLLAQAYEVTEDLRKLRQDVADSIT